MAKELFSDLDMNKNELIEAVLQNLSLNPSSPATGQLYFNTASSKILFYNGTTWIEVGTISSQEVTLQEFLTEEFVDIREGLVAWVVPSSLNGYKITEFIAKVTTKNDDVTLQLNKNGVLLTGTSTSITTAAGSTVSGLSLSLATGDIIQVETTVVNATPSKGLIVSITIEP